MQALAYPNVEGCMMGQPRMSAEPSTISGTPQKHVGSLGISHDLVMLLEV